LFPCPARPEARPRPPGCIWARVDSESVRKVSCRIA
jgi:hypothetical protein